MTHNGHRCSKRCDVGPSLGLSGDGRLEMSIASKLQKISIALVLALVAGGAQSEARPLKVIGDPPLEVGGERSGVEKLTFHSA
jgi:hypothetical protein